MTKSTNMMKLKCSVHSCLRACNFDGVKVIDGICIESNLIGQSEPNKHRTKTENPNNAATRRRTTQHRTKTTRSQKKILNICDKYLFEWKEKKNNSDGDFGSKIDLKTTSTKKKRKLGFEKGRWLLTLLCYGVVREVLETLFFKHFLHLFFNWLKLIWISYFKNWSHIK
jgi:hypothetical protein